MFRNGVPPAPTCAENLQQTARSRLLTSTSHAVPLALQLEKCKEATGGDLGRGSADSTLQIPAPQVMQQMGMSAELQGPPQQLQQGQEHLQEGMLGGSIAPGEEQHDGAPAPTAEACVLPVINSQLAALANVNPAGPPVQ